MKARFHLCMNEKNATTIFVYGKENPLVRLNNVKCVLLLLSLDFSSFSLTVASQNSSARMWNMIRADIDTELGDARAGHAASRHDRVRCESADCEAGGVVIVVPQECRDLSNDAIPVALIEGVALSACRLAGHFDATRGERVSPARQWDAVEPSARTSIWLSGECGGQSAGRALAKVSAVVGALLGVRAA